MFSPLSPSGSPGPENPLLLFPREAPASPRDSALIGGPTVPIVNRVAGAGVLSGSGSGAGAIFLSGSGSYSYPNVKHVIFTGTYSLL